MTYLIDGHNLIGKMRDIHLEDLDDENHLLDRLETYFKKARKKAIVFFDRGQPGNSRKINRAFIQARFVPETGDADTAIANFLESLGGNARNFTVVSSDNAVIQAAGRFGAKVVSSVDFSRRVSDSSISSKTSPKPEDPEVGYWLDKFTGDS